MPGTTDSNVRQLLMENLPLGGQAFKHAWKHIISDENLAKAAALTAMHSENSRRSQ